MIKSERKQLKNSSKRVKELNSAEKLNSFLKKSELSNFEENIDGLEIL